MKLSLVSRSGRLLHTSAALAVALGCCLAIAPDLWAQPLTAGRNVNTSGGPYNLSTNASGVLEILGDPKQRQNEPSIACSSRNPRHCVMGANDYRAVNLPGLPADRETGDSWLGLFWTRDGGSTWRSTLLPGFLQDVSPAGLASPLKGFDAAADPTVRAGANGLFYYSGIAFPRAPASGGTSHNGAGGSGVVFVTTLIDDDNSDNPEIQPRNIGTVIIDSAAQGEVFLDKTWVAVDVPGPGARTFTVPGQGGPLSAGNVYVAYVKFVGTSQRAKLMFARSTDGGRTYGTQKLSEGLSRVQSPFISIDPNTGDVWIVCRQFALTGDPDRIIAFRSTDRGQTFSRDINIRTMRDATSQSTAFDQSTQPTSVSTARAIRTNSYPSACVDGPTGRLYVLWSELGPLGLTDRAQIYYSTTTDGSQWSAPLPVDDGPNAFGDKFMPSVTCAGGKVTAIWYDQRNDFIRNFTHSLYGLFFWDPIVFSDIQRTFRTLDVYSAMAEPGKGFLFTDYSLGTDGQPKRPSTKVSRYLYGVARTGQVVQLNYNKEGAPLFGGGILPFIGDYIDVAASPSILPPIAGRPWRFNTDPDIPTVFHGVWGDNRDVAAVNTNQFLNWVPPVDPNSCSALLPENRTRDQNVYTAQLTTGLVAGSPGNARTLAGTTQRAFVVYVQNTTAAEKLIQLTLNQPSTGTASFVQFPADTLDNLQAAVPPHTQMARTVFVKSTNAQELVKIDIAENIGGSPVSQGSVILNPDPTAPNPVDLDVASFNETHDVSVSDPTISTSIYPTTSISVDPSFINPDFLDPDFLDASHLNPDFLDPDFLDPDFLDPDFLDPDFLDPDFLDADIRNPDFLDPDFLDSSITSYTWNVENKGNVASSYVFRPVSSGTGDHSHTQLLIYRVSSSPSCTLGTSSHQELAANVRNPDFLDSSLVNGLSSSSTNSTFFLAPGEKIKVKLRVSNNHPVPVNPAPAVVPAAGNPKSPVALMQRLTLNEDSQISVVVNGLAPDGTQSSTLWPFAVVIAPTHGVLSGSAPNLTYAPAPNFNGTDSFTFTLTYPNPDGTTSFSTATVALVVAPSNDAPSASGQSVATNEDTAVGITLVGSDLETPASNLLFNVAQPGHGTLSGMAPNLTYTPFANYNGSDSFTFTVTDTGDGAAAALSSAPATVAITVNAVNDAPSASGQIVTTNEDTAIGIVLVGSDTETAAGSLAFNVASPSHGALSGTAPNLMYTPSANYNGPDSFTFTVTDTGDGAAGALTSAAATVSITVNPVNDAPVANNQLVVATEDIPAFVNLTGSDLESGNNLSFAVTALPAHGSLSGTPPNLMYTPAVNYNGLDSFTFTVTDTGDGAAGALTSAAATVAITITGVNDAPSFTKGLDQTVLEDAGPQSVSNWATGISAGPADEGGQLLTFNVTDYTNPGLFSVAPAVSPSGTLTYTPAANANGSATITLTLSDNGGTANGGVDTSAPQTLSITVNSVNDVPSFAKGADQTVNEDAGPQTVPAWATSISAGPPDESAQLLDFIVANNNMGLFAAQPGIGPDGTLTYTPAANANGMANVTVQLHDDGVTANGGVDTSATQSFTILINPADDAPVANIQSVTTNEDTAKAIVLTAADVDSSLLTYNIVAGPTHGTLSGALLPNVIYTPSLNYNGADSFTFKVNDGFLDSNIAVVSITVNSVNDAPVAVNDSYTVNQGSVLSVGAPGVLGNDSDVDNPTLTALLVSGPSSGTLTLNANGSFAYTPNPTYSGPDSFTYKSSDGSAVSNVATANIVVNATLYTFVNVQNLPPPAGKTFNSGSSAPLRWQWLMNGSGATSVNAAPQITVTGPSPTQTYTVQSPGKSSFQLPTASNNYTWGFNWQTVDAKGVALPKGTYNITIRSLQTGQISGPFPLTLR